MGASAHYYVGFQGEIWQSVEDGDIAWHCGAKTYRHPECRNSNSLGIELCVRNKGSKAADGVRWWYQSQDGSFARGGWYWLTEMTGGTSGWYLFDKEGYMLTGRQRDGAGEWFYLCPDPGIHEGKCMVTDRRGALKSVGEYDFKNHCYL